MTKNTPEEQKRRDTLIAEFVYKQVWQFLSLDEWLEGNGCAPMKYD